MQIQILVKPAGVVVKSAPAFLLRAFELAIPFPVSIDSQITWIPRTEKFYRHGRAPGSKTKGIPTFLDIKTAEKLRNSKFSEHVRLGHQREERRIQALPLANRWTYFGLGCLERITSLLDGHGYHYSIEDRRPANELLLQGINQNYYESLDPSNQELAKLWAQQCLAWTQAAPGKNYQSAADLAMLNREQSLVIVMASSKRELHNFQGYIAKKYRPRIQFWGDKGALSPRRIYLATPHFGIPLHCLHPITLIVLSTERILHHKQFNDWCYWAPIHRKYGIVSSDARFTPSDAEKLKIVFGAALPCQQEFQNPAKITSYTARLDSTMDAGPPCKDLLTWKRLAIWTNVGRNRLIADLAGYLDGNSSCLAAEIKLSEHSEIRERRGATKQQTLILVENKLHGQQVQSQLPDYRLVERSSVSPAGFVLYEERYRGSIMTLPAFEALQSYGADLVIRADGTKAQLDVTKTILPRPFQARQQTVIEIVEPRHLNRDKAGKRRTNFRR